MRFVESIAIITLLLQSTFTIASRVDGQSLQRFQRRRPLQASRQLHPVNAGNPIEHPKGHTSSPENVDKPIEHPKDHDSSPQDLENRNERAQKTNSLSQFHATTEEVGKNVAKDIVPTGNTSVIVVEVDELNISQTFEGAASSYPLAELQGNGSRYYTCENNKLVYDCTKANLHDKEGNVLGTHSNQAGTYSFDLTKFLKDKTAYFVGFNTKAMTSPNGTSNLPWLQIEKMDGNLAGKVYRIKTRGGNKKVGQKCSQTHQVVTEPFSAHYVFYA